MSREDLALVREILCGVAGVDRYLREGVATLLSLTILFGTGFMLLDTYLTARGGLDAAGVAFGRQKDVLQIAIALLGTVTGYYLGRVPAEKRADQAEERETKAVNVASQDEKKHMELRRTVHSQLLQINRALNVEAGSPGSASGLVDQLLIEVELGHQ